MQSLADLLQFFFRIQPMTGLGASDPTTMPRIPSGPQNSSLSAGPFPPFDVFARPPHNSDDQQPIFAPGDFSFYNPGTSASQSPVTRVPTGPSGGILGGLPFATGGASDPTGPSGGILGSLPFATDDARPRATLSADRQSVAAQNPADALTTRIPLWSDSLAPMIGSDSRIAAPRIPSGALSNQPSIAQAFFPNQKLAARDYPQADGVGPYSWPLTTDLMSPQWGQPRHAVGAQPEFSNAETYRKFNISALLHPRDMGDPNVGFGDNSASPPPSPGPEGDWPAYFQRAQVIDPSAVTGNPRIDRNTEILLDTLVEAVNELGVDPSAEMRSVIFGTLAHSHFARKVRALDLPGIGQDGVEQSWHAGDWWLTESQVRSALIFI